MPFLWGLVIGVVFSTVGAAGGMLAGFGHISLFGLKDPNAVKVMNQILVALSPLISVPLYFKKGRLILSLGLLTGLGAVTGALVGSALSFFFLSDLKLYKKLFGLFTLAVSLVLLYATVKGSAASLKSFDEELKEKGGKTVAVNRSFKSFEYEFLNRRIAFNPFAVFLVGFLVSAVAAALGVGGGFALVFFMVYVLKVPAVVAAGTASLAVFISAVVGAFNYLRLGAPVYWEILLPEALGVLVGSFFGPFISHRLGEKRLRMMLAVLLFLLGLRYALG
ncbi:MAG: sulfite exporter TauE/SafE family protein [Aquificae bacterium]|nr:sulfite exporter TauE/SafE family protein [Aquificota bacterium]